ncbi:MAG: aminotransferase class IV [Dehalococcoidales bacterium]|nr:aminotransferase class IV [Dehalococcoidales bacterium]
MEEIVYLNGVMLPVSEAKISAMDYGFLYGYGLFETMLARSGAVFRIDSHLTRLAKSAERLGIAVDIAVIRKAVIDTLEVNGLRDARVRLAISIGEGSLVPDPRSCAGITILVAAAKYKPYPDEYYERGFRVIISSIRRNSQSPVTAMKTANYMESLLARQEAKASCVDDALFLNEKGQLAEASTSNVFLVSNNLLKTPRQESGILPGITRDVILELSLKTGIIASEEDIHLEELPDAAEAFLTNSILGIMPVTYLNGTAIGGGRPGPITRRLMSVYNDLVIKETGQPDS